MKKLLRQLPLANYLLPIANCLFAFPMKNRDFASLNLLFAICFLPFASCTPELKAPQPSAGECDFTKSIAVGGNYLAGYQDGALYRKGQTLSIPALLAEQFKLVGGNAFNQALMPDNNGIGINPKPWENHFNTPFILRYATDCKGVTSLTPTNDSLSISASTPYLTGVAGNSIQNLAVPFANLSDYFNPAFGNSFAAGNPNPYYNRIASNPGVSTLYADEIAQNATFFTAWLGMEDIYNYASNGGEVGTLPSMFAFSNMVDTILKGLTAHGAKGILATIPDFRNFPFYTLVPWNAADMTQSQADSLTDFYAFTGADIHFHQGKNGFILIDPSAIGGARLLKEGEYLTLSVPLDSMKCHNYGLLITMMNKRYVLDSTEVADIDFAITSYNSIITQKAQQYNLALADMHQFFNAVKTGIKWDGADYNEEFVTGGFFSLDGYHPNQKGYALIANEFINAINLKYKAFIPYVNCVDCDGVKFP